jgi:hypothetical protein
MSFPLTPDYQPNPHPRLVHDKTPVQIGVVEEIEPDSGTAPGQLDPYDKPSDPATGLELPPM